MMSLNTQQMLDSKYKSLYGEVKPYKSKNPDLVKINKIWNSRSIDWTVKNKFYHPGDTLVDPKDCWFRGWHDWDDEILGDMSWSDVYFKHVTKAKWYDGVNTLSALSGVSADKTECILYAIFRYQVSDKMSKAVMKIHMQRAETAIQELGYDCYLMLADDQNLDTTGADFIADPEWSDKNYVVQSKESVKAWAAATKTKKTNAYAQLKHYVKLDEDPNVVFLMYDETERKIYTLSEII